MASLDAKQSIKYMHCQCRKNKLISALFLIGLLVVCLDVINIDLGAFKLKIAHVAFIFYIALFLHLYGISHNRNNIRIALIFIASLIPSLIFSTSIVTSIAFYAGAIMCVIIMLVFSKMTSVIGFGVVELLLKFYRFSVLLTALLMLFRLQDRGHFILYEPSYYAIALIPYFCITFHRLLTFGFKSTRIDLFFIIAAIGLSASVSMALWTVVCFISLAIKFQKMQKRYIAIMLIFLSFLLYSIYQFHSRTHLIIDNIIAVFYDPTGYLNLVLYVVGNRLQRILVAYEAFTSHVWYGVGLGSLREYSTLYFDIENFTIDGLTASDFITEMNATNVFMEISAEAGVIGFVGFIMLLRFIHKKNGNSEFLLPFKVAFYVTMTALLIESSYLRTYVWALYGIIIGLSSIREVDTKLVYKRPIKLNL